MNARELKMSPAQLAAEAELRNLDPAASPSGEAPEGDSMRALAEDTVRRLNGLARRLESVEAGEAPERGDGLAPWYEADGSTVMLPAEEVERRRKLAAVALKAARVVVGVATQKDVCGAIWVIPDAEFQALACALDDLGAPERRDGEGEAANPWPPMDEAGSHSPLAETLREEMAARGWTEEFVIARLGDPVEGVAFEILLAAHHDRLTLSAASAEALGRVFSVSPWFFLALDATTRRLGYAMAPRPSPRGTGTEGGK